MKIIQCFSFLACARTVGVNLDKSFDDAGLTNCNFGQDSILLNYNRYLQCVHSAVTSAIKSYMSKTEQTEHVCRESSRIAHDAVRTVRLEYQCIHPITSAFGIASTCCGEQVNGYSAAGPINAGYQRDFPTHGNMIAAAVAAPGYHTDRFGKLLETIKVRVMYQVKDTSLYLQMNDKDQISAVHLNDNNKDSGVYVIRRVYASDNKLDNFVQIGRNGTSWIQVVGYSTTLAADATTFKCNKTGDDVSFEYYDMSMCYDKKRHTIDMISTKIALQTERLQCVFIEIPV